MSIRKIIYIFLTFALMLTYLLFEWVAVSAASISITNEQELRDAIADTAIDTIVIASGITVSIEATIVIDRPLTLTGGGTLAVRQDGQRVLAWVSRNPSPGGNYPHHPGLDTPTAYFDTSPWANPGGNVPTEGAVWLPRGGQTGAMLRIVSDNVTVSNITLVGRATTTSHNHVSGIHVRDANNVVLRDLHIREMNHGAPEGIMDPMGGWGIDILNSNVEILRSRFDRFNNQAIRQTGGNSFIQDNIIIGMNDNNDFRAKSGIQIGTGVQSATLIGNRIENFRFTGYPEWALSNASAAGVLIFSGIVEMRENTFEYMDVGVIVSGGWGDPQVTMWDTVFNDVTAYRPDITPGFPNDLFIRVESGAGASGNFATVTNHDAIWADRISFPFGGGIYNGALVTTPGTAAAQKIAEWSSWDALPIGPPTAPASNAAVVTFYYPESYSPRPLDPRGMLLLTLPNIHGNRISDDRLRPHGGLIVWAAVDGYIRGSLSEFPIATHPNYAIVGWRDWPYDSTADVEVLPNPLLVWQPRTIVPVLERDYNTNGYTNGSVNDELTSNPRNSNVSGGNSGFRNSHIYTEPDYGILGSYIAPTNPSTGSLALNVFGVATFTKSSVLWNVAAALSLLAAWILLFVRKKRRR